MFSTFFDNSDETEDADAAGAEAISSDPALYWAKLKRHKSRRKNGALRGSYTGNIDYVDLIACPSDQQ